MATAKKATKPAATKAKRAPSKATKTTTRAKSTAPKRAAAKTTSSSTFFTFRATHETVYWLILGVVVVLMAVWVLSLTIRVQNLYDQMEINSASDVVHTPAKATKQ